VSYPDKSFGKESRIGVPFTFLLRNILQFDDTLNASITRIKTAHRTCDLILGVGDGKPEAETVRGFEVRELATPLVFCHHTDTMLGFSTPRP